MYVNLKIDLEALLNIEIRSEYQSQICVPDTVSFGIKYSWRKSFKTSEHISKSPECTRCHRKL